MITLPLAGALVVASLTPRLVEEDPNSKLKGVIDDAGPVAGLFVLLLGVAIFFLWRSLSKQMNRIDPSLPSGRDDREQAADRALQAEAVERGDAGRPGEAGSPDPGEPAGA
jgi:hypothetical protein